jgi:hypothetical protein
VSWCPLHRWAAPRKRGYCLAPGAALLHLDMTIVQDMLTKIHAIASPGRACSPHVMMMCADPTSLVASAASSECFHLLATDHWPWHWPPITGLGTGHRSLALALATDHWPWHWPPITGLGTGLVTLHLPTHKQHVVALARMATTNVRHCPLTPTRAWPRPMCVTVHSLPHAHGHDQCASLSTHSHTRMATAAECTQILKRIPPSRTRCKTDEAAPAR